MKRCTGCCNDFPELTYSIRLRWPDGTVRSRHARCAICRAEHYLKAKARRAAATDAVDREATTWLDAGPWRAWLGRALMREPDQATLAAMLDIDQRRLFAWLHQAKRVRLDNVDAALCAYGEPWLLREIYPDLYVFNESEAA